MTQRLHFAKTTLQLRLMCSLVSLPCAKKRCPVRFLGTFRKVRKGIGMSVCEMFSGHRSNVYQVIRIVGRVGGAS